MRKSWVVRVLIFNRRWFAREKEALFTEDLRVDMFAWPGASDIDVNTVILVNKRTRGKGRGQQLHSRGTPGAGAGRGRDSTRIVGDTEGGGRVMLCFFVSIFFSIFFFSRSRAYSASFLLCVVYVSRW